MTTATTTDLQIELRPYQRDALTAIDAAALCGVRRQIISLPTGAGKAVIFCHLLVAQQTRQRGGFYSSNSLRKHRSCLCPYDFLSF
jgi:superfamily II DNA or RNA helicase